MVAEQAAGVSISGRNVERGKALAEELTGLGTPTIFVRTELENSDECRNLLRQSEAHFGRLDGLVNSAGITTRGTLEESSVELWDQHMAVNARAPFLTMQEAVIIMQKQGWGGSIVNIITKSAHGGQPFLTPYSSSKGALATLTKKINLVTSVAVLPLHDMRTYAGEVAVADILTGGRLILGVARGAFAWEMGRLGSPIEDSKEKFIESLEVLESLLTKENFSYEGKYYQFDSITIMPRPISNPVPIMIAAMDPSSIRNAAAEGYHVQSTVLSGKKKLLLERTNAFKEGKEKAKESRKMMK